MRLYTRQGDDGKTSLRDGTRVDKDAARVAGYGCVDELNACLGLVRAAGPPEPLPARLVHVQEQLLAIGAHLSSPPAAQTHPFRGGRDEVTTLESWIDEATAAVSPLKSFILPGGGEVAARLHHARTVCRRAERAVVAVLRAEGVDPEVLRYLNRLSDLLFAWARFANRAAGIEESRWQARPSPGER